jgi:prepilin peptidase CpaA
MFTLASAAAVTVALIGCVTDLQSRRIPNAVTLTAAVAAFAFHAFVGGWTDLGWSLAGWATGLAIFFPLFLLRGLGGGDVKLMAALGAWLLPATTVWLALYAALAGGALAVVVSVSGGYLWKALGNIWGLLIFWRVMGLRPHPEMTLESAGSPRLPYALPIAAGLVLTLWLQ